MCSVSSLGVTFHFKFRQFRFGIVRIKCFLGTKADVFDVFLEEGWA